MAVIGTVVAILGDGAASVINQAGAQTLLKLNDTVQPGDTIVTPRGVVVELQLVNGRKILISAEQTVKFTQELADIMAPSPDENAIELATIEAVIKAIEEGRDISEVLEETAAGLVAGGTSAYGHSFVDLARITEDGISDLDLESTSAIIAGDGDQTLYGDNEFTIPNQPATLSSALALLEETNEPLTTSGVLTISDPDSPATFIAQTNVSGSYGIFSINAAGEWTYVANSAFDELNVGDSYTDIFVVSSADGTTTTVTVTITGTNDAAVITGDSAASLTESDEAQSTGGTLIATDVDSPNTFVPQTNAAGSNGYGVFSINAAGEWTYTMNNAQNQFVAGETYTDSITVETADGTTQVITVTIVGTNDAAEIGGTDTGSVTEDASDPVLTTSGTLTISDADTGEAYFQTGGITASPGALGSLSITAVGVWTYTVANAAVQYLGEGETRTETFTVLAADETPHEITITVTGTNDAPVISSGV
ncbi:MAG: hypothetical protein RL194_460, partial [Pseudomonadota bacterium]